MGPVLKSVTTYNLTGHGTTVTYSDDAEPQLMYEDGEGKRQFSGKTISRQTIQVGQVVSVILKAAPDEDIVILSVVVPAANRPEAVRSIPVKTFAVRTRSRTNLGGPGLVEGQLQTYDVHLLEGNAW